MTCLKNHPQICNLTPVFPVLASDQIASSPPHDHFPILLNNHPSLFHLPLLIFYVQLGLLLSPQFLTPDGESFELCCSYHHSEVFRGAFIRNSRLILSHLNKLNSSFWAFVSEMRSHSKSSEQFTFQVIYQLKLIQSGPLQITAQP